MSVRAAADLAVFVACGMCLVLLPTTIPLAALTLVFAFTSLVPAQSVDAESGLVSHKEVELDLGIPARALENKGIDELGSDFLLEQIRNLSSPSYRAREMAIWRLEQQPAATIELISEQLAKCDLNSGSRLIELLSKFATQPEMSIGVAAMKTLESAAEEKISVLAYLAQNSLQAIAETQETQAIDILTHLGAEIGYPKLMINGIKQNEGISTPIRIIRIDSRFTGSATDMPRFRFLQQVDTVFLHKIRVDAELVRSIGQMPNLKMVVLSHVDISVADLQHFQEFKNLDHFELSYVPVDDAALLILERLPVWGSMRLFGTKISREGGEQLKKRLDGLSLYFGRGGFLGIGTLQPTNLVISQVTPGSAADRAKLRSADKLTHINSVPIKTFDELRAELAKYGPAEKIRIQYQRNRVTESVDVELGEAPVPAGER